MKKLFVISLVIIFGVIISDCYAKKPKKAKLTDEEIKAKIDSLRMEYEKRREFDSFEQKHYDRGGWDQAAKFTHYYCLGDYLYGDDFDIDNQNTKYLKLEEEQSKFRFKLYELCPNYKEDRTPSEAIIAYTMHEKETDSIVCRQKAVNKLMHNIFAIVQHRLSPLYVFGELYLKPNDLTKEVTCDKLWKGNLIQASIPRGFAQLFNTRQSAEHVGGLIRANTMICDTTMKVEDEYKCFAVAKMSIKPLAEWLETLLTDAEEKETWKIVLHELLYNPTNDSRVVVGIIHYYL